MDRRGASPRMRLGAAQVDVPAEPDRPRRAPLLAADRGRSEPAGGRPAVVHDDVRPGQHLHQPPGPAVPVGAGRDDAPRPRRLAGNADRRLPRRGPGPDPARDALRRDGRVRGAAALAVLRLGRRHAALRDPARRVRALDRRPGARPRSRARGPGRDQLDRRVRRPHGQRLHLVQAPQREDGSREPELEGLLELDLVRRRTAAGLPAGDVRAPGLRLRREGPRRPAGPPRLEGPGLRRQAGSRGRRPQAPLQPRLLAGRPGLLRARARRRRQPGRLARLEQRAAALERHRRRQQGQVRRRAPHGPAALVGLGRPDAGRGRGPLQPGRLPPRDGLAVRQLVHRLGAAAVRLQGGGREDRVRHPRRRRCLRGPAAGGVRRLRPRPHEVPGEVPDGLQPAGLVDRRPAAAAPDDARARADGRPPDRRPVAADRASATSSCSTSPVDGAGSTRSDAAGSQLDDGRSHNGNGQKAAGRATAGKAKP